MKLPKRLHSICQTPHPTPPPFRIVGRNSQTGCIRSIEPHTLHPNLSLEGCLAERGIPEVHIPLPPPLSQDEAVKQAVLDVSNPTPQTLVLRFCITPAPLRLGLHVRSLGLRVSLSFSLFLSLSLSLPLSLSLSPSLPPSLSLSLHISSLIAG